MAKISFKNIDRVSSSLEKRMIDIAQKTIEEKIKEISELIINDIRGQTRSGKDIPNDRRQPPLAKSTIETRSYSEKYTPTHPLYSKRRSNLTVTGQLLDAVKATIRKLGGKTGHEITFEVEDSVRETYKSPKARTNNNQRLTNKKLAEYLKDKGREFLGIRKLMLERIRNQIRQDLRRKIRQVLK